MIRIIAQLIFHLMMLFFGIYSLVMVYVLIRFGESKTIGILITVLYFIVMGSLYAAATANFYHIPFPRL